MYMCLLFVYMLVTNTRAVPSEEGIRASGSRVT